jgi:MFS family permease
MSSVQEAARALRGNRDFLKLWTAQTISKFGSHIGHAAIEFTAILNLRATPAQMGLLSAFGSAPILVVGLFTGVWVDRLRRRPILVAADLGRAVLLVALFLVAALGQLRIEHLYLAAALVGVLTVLYGVADQSALPGLVRREQLIEANSRLGASDSVAEIGGPALGGTLVQWLTAPFALLLDAFSFLVSALFIGLIRRPEPLPELRETGSSLSREMLEGLRVVWDEANLRALALAAATQSFFGGFFASLYALFLVRDLGLTPALVGMSVGLGGAGALMGAFAADPVTRRFGVGRTMIGALLISSALQACIPLAGGPLFVILLCLAAAQLLGDTGWAIYRINEVSLRQALIPHRFLGRANASMDFLAQGMGPVGALVGGALGQLIGMRLTLLIAVAGFLLSSLWLLASPLVRMRSLDEPRLTT